MTITRLHKRIATAVAVAIASGASFGVVRTAAADSAGVTRADAGENVVASLSERKLYIKEGDAVVQTFPVAVGKGSKPTPPGNYKIRKIVWNPEWIPPAQPWAKDKKPQPPGAKANPMKLVKIFFHEPDYYIHGTGDVESLGSAASHGCLRMDPDDAYQVAKYLMDHGGQPRDESWFWRVLHFRSETKTVYLDHPIPMVVTE